MCVPLRAGWIAAGARSCDLRADQLVDPLEIPVRSDLTVGNCTAAGTSI